LADKARLALVSVFATPTAVAVLARRAPISR
jgi:hypothetical protein